MKHFKFKTTMKVTGYRARAIQGIAFTEKRVTASQAAEQINERVAIMARNNLKQAGEFPENLINSIEFKTTVGALTVNYAFSLDKPMVEPEGAAAPSGE